MSTHDNGLGGGGGAAVTATTGEQLLATVNDSNDSKLMPDNRGMAWEWGQRIEPASLERQRQRQGKG